MVINGKIQPRGIELYYISSIPLQKDTRRLEICGIIMVHWGIIFGGYLQMNKCVNH
jgi:hypothetical protein